MINSVINDPTTLREHFGEPLEVAVACVRTHLDTYQKLFIEHSPFICLGTADKNGQPVISPKGDTPGFVKIVDDYTLLIPDRNGNNKVESFANIIENPRVALIFFVPGQAETLRLWGKASITTDQQLLSFAQVGKNPVNTGLRIDITKSYLHCGKAAIRSKMWKEDSHIEKGIFPPFGKMLKEQGQLAASEAEVEAVVQDLYTNKLY